MSARESDAVVAAASKKVRRWRSLLVPLNETDGRKKRPRAAGTKRRVFTTLKGEQTLRHATLREIAE